jgi:hypothetical protein
LKRSEIASLQSLHSHISWNSEVYNRGGQFDELLQSHIMTHLGRIDSLIKLTNLVPSLIRSYLSSFKQNRLSSVRIVSPFFRKFLNRRPQPASYASKHLPLLPRWHHTPMRIFASLMDFSQSALFFDFPFQFLSFHVLIYVCLHFRHLFPCRSLNKCY